MDEEKKGLVMFFSHAIMPYALITTIHPSIDW